MSEAITSAIRKVVRGTILTPGEMRAAMTAILSGDASDVQIAGFAIALRMRGETSAEIGAAARALRDASDPLVAPHTGPILDTCGTGGDGAETFNISTVAAIVVAGCGVRVAKHGNRAVSSRAGSADLLQALGVNIDASHEVLARCLDEVRITFLFAPAHHAALRHAASARRALGVRTFFNLLGPLANPGGATHQLVGVYDPARLEQVAEALCELGIEGAWVVHGEGGLDEISTSGPTQVVVLRDGAVTRRTVEPRDFGLDRAPIESLAGGDAEDNAEIARRVLGGDRGGPRTAVLLNAAAALCASDAALQPEAAALRCAKAIDDGEAAGLLDRWVAMTR